MRRQPLPPDRAVCPVPHALPRANGQRIYWQFPITAIREIKILKVLNHKNIVRLKEIVTSKGARATVSSHCGLHTRPEARATDSAACCGLHMRPRPGVGSTCSARVGARPEVTAFCSQQVSTTMAKVQSTWSWSFATMTSLA